MENKEHRLFIWTANYFDSWFMSKVGDLLNRTVRDEKNVTKSYLSLSITVYIVIICSVLISCFLFLGLQFVLDVDGYLQDNKQIIHLYNFYDQRVGENETAIFFFGSSLVGYAIYPPEVNRIIKTNYPNITAYDLAVDGDLPIVRSLEMQKIIDSKPSLVIFGITYRDIATSYIDESSLFERTKLVFSRLNIRNDSLWLYSENEKMFFSPLSDFEKTKYLRSAIEYKLTGKTPYGSMNYSYDPYGGEKLRARVSLLKDEYQIIADANNPNNGWRPVVTNESTRNKEALLYNVKTLQDAGIPVIILNMPIHPLLSEKITDESRANFYDLLNKSGVVWYDLERDYCDDYFRDTRHANHNGSIMIAPRIADLIIEQVEKDVIHYT